MITDDLKDTGTKEWYLSCTTEDHTLVGVQKVDEWTCPVVGLTKLPVTHEQIIDLVHHSINVTGPYDSENINVIARAEWARIMNEPNVLEEWGNSSPLLVWIATDGEFVIRLHMAFE